MLSKFTIVLKLVVNLKSLQIFSTLIEISPLEAVSNSTAASGVARICVKIV